MSRGIIVGAEGMVKQKREWEGLERVNKREKEREIEWEEKKRVAR